MNAVAQFSPTLAKILEVPMVLPATIFLVALFALVAVVVTLELITGKNLGQLLGM